MLKALQGGTQQRTQAPSAFHEADSSEEGMGQSQLGIKILGPKQPWPHGEDGIGASVYPSSVSKWNRSLCTSSQNKRSGALASCSKELPSTVRFRICSWEETTKTLPKAKVKGGKRPEARNQSIDLFRAQEPLRPGCKSSQMKTCK